MLKDLTKGDWLRILSIPESRIPSVLILRGTRNFRVQHQAMLPFFENVLEVGAPNGILEDVFIGERRGIGIGFACVYGPSMASEIVHVFGVLGTRAVIQTGNCGALADRIAAGDLFVATGAFCGEGTAAYYLPSQEVISASEDLIASQTVVGAVRHGCHFGTIYTTSALFAESAEDLERWSERGFAAVDMETATTYAVAEYFGMRRLSILYAFDNPRRQEHLLLSDAEKDARRSLGNARMRELAFSLAEELSAE
jgi:purine-nucleoside phosphorylase